MMSNKDFFPISNKHSKVLRKHTAWKIQAILVYCYKVSKS